MFRDKTGVGCEMLQRKLGPKGLARKVSGCFWPFCKEALNERFRRLLSLDPAKGGGGASGVLGLGAWIGMNLLKLGLSAAFFKQLGKLAMI